MKTMNTPRTRAEFERNFNLLHRDIEEGKLHLPADFSFDSLERVRNLPNGRLDFLSIDELARLNANMTANVKDGLFDEQWKEYRGPTDEAVSEDKGDLPPSTFDAKHD